MGVIRPAGLHMRVAIFSRTSSSFTGRVLKPARRQQSTPASCTKTGSFSAALPIWSSSRSNRAPAKSLPPLGVKRYRRIILLRVLLTPPLLINQRESRSRVVLAAARSTTWLRTREHSNGDVTINPWSYHMVYSSRLDFPYRLRLGREL